KYYNTAVRDAYRTVEQSACDTILSLLPDTLRDAYRPMFVPEEADAPLWRFVKAADKICALTKCVAERQAGNLEFEQAAASTREAIRQMHCPEADLYLEAFLPGFRKTLDELRK
ncbi:MAG: 5'-deoxynucleotidase, partial [Clostridia bacterium]|nr:5'-deoxynucleotidase [Clostridia bacterium]